MFSSSCAIEARRAESLNSFVAKRPAIVKQSAIERFLGRIARRERRLSR
jgi:hypothetical protein